MSRTIRFGILSFAHYHANFWAQVMQETPAAILAGIWDDDPRRGQEAAERYGTRFWPDRAALLRDCDAAGVTSETVYHPDLIEDAAAAGVHVLCEKPMACTLEDCDRIERAVAAGGILFMQNFPKRFDPVNRELVELVQRGDLGQISIVRVRHGHGHGQDTAFQQQWFIDPRLSGGGTLLDEGVHAADFLLWLLGPPERVSAAISNRLLGLPVEDSACATFTYPSGALAEVCTSWSFLAAEGSVEVYGTAGAAVISGVDLASRSFSALPYLRVFLRGDQPGTWRASPTVPAFVTGNFHQQGPSYFISCLRDGLPPVVGAREGRQSAAMVLAAYRAAATGGSQPVAGQHPEDANA